ncbi:hypothetical protein L6230_02840 [Pseudomonas syringae pv. syringae]|nr:MULTISPECIES: hypothetical protein [Pseudomonas syringae group]MCH5553403.1 hypothetical protein [Pseudomonas syringae pv. syringae]MCH5573412.1 hypothetical protein [Pseudomonas syringae pv. syringae]MCH5665784.1 hypothetical protein [Pseudomonas syringae pv. syringae]MDF5772939.1 hypothetical protein [Pseudomonas syringae pv. syringae]
MSAHQKKHPFDFKTQYGLGFNPQNDEIVVDFFCGGGGAGTGLEIGLGRTVSVAKNHSPAAISMHTVNHTTVRLSGSEKRRARWLSSSSATDQQGTNSSGQALVSAPQATIYRRTLCTHSW